MTETTSSQSQQNTSSNAKAHPFAAFGFPFPMPSFDPAAFTLGGVAEAWQKAAAEQQTRLAAMFEEYAKAEEKAVAEARRAIEEMTRLSLATLDYAREQGANLRKTVLDLSKKAAEATSVDAKKA